MKSAADRPRRNNRGHSVIEALVATSIFLIIIAGVFQVFAQNQQGYDVQVELNDAQLSSRGIVLETGRLLRAAGYGMPLHSSLASAAATGADIADGRELSTIVANLAVASNASSLNVRGNFSVPSVEGLLDAASPALTSPSPGAGPFPTVRVSFSSTAVRDQLNTGAGVYVYDQNSWHYGLVNAVTAVSGTVADVALNLRSASTSLSKAYPPGALLRRSETATIRSGDGTVTRALNGVSEVIGTNIQSMTFRYFKADGAEVTSFPMSITDRMALTTVRLTVVARTASRDPRTRQYRTFTVSTDFSTRMRTPS